MFAVGDRVRINNRSCTQHDCEGTVTYVRVGSKRGPYYDVKVDAGMLNPARTIMFFNKHVLQQGD